MLKLWWEHFIQYISTVNGNYLQQIVQFSLLVFEGDLSFLNFFFVKTNLNITYILTLNTFSKKKKIVHFQCIVSSRFTAEAGKHHCCLWTEAGMSILANQNAVFRSGDKAASHFERMR